MPSTTDDGIRLPLDTRAIRRAAARLRALADDLEAAADGHMPDALALRDAPLLDAWELSARPAACLTGIRYGHSVATASRPSLRTSICWMRAWGSPGQRRSPRQPRETTTRPRGCGLRAGDATGPVG